MPPKSSRSARSGSPATNVRAAWTSGPNRFRSRAPARCSNANCEGFTRKTARRRRPRRDDSRRADFEHLAVVAGLERDPKLPNAVALRHHRHHGNDRLAHAVVERGLHVWLLAEPDQVARGRKRQLEPPALAAVERLARRHPDRIGGFLAVMGAGLFWWGGGQEEPGVEPFWHALRGNPVRIGHELIERQHHAVVGKHL